MTTPTEESNLQRAIELSLEQANNISRQAETGQQQSETIDQMSQTEPPVSPHKRGIADCIQELTENMRFIELPRVGQLDGDTFVFIDPPYGYGDPSDPVALAVQERYQKPFRVRSACLRAADSPVLNKMFTPDYQFRILRRRSLVNKLPLGVKYVLDLTPSIEGDDAVSLIMELSCSMGVRLWALSLFRWNVSATLIGGGDEFTKLSSQNRLQQLKRAAKSTWRNTGNITENNVQGSPSGPAVEPTPGNDIAGEPSTDMGIEVPPDYTDLRHRSAIERVLLALEGQDPSLNSAPKVFTTAVVASKVFGIQSSPLNDYIVRWLRAEPNSNIIEALPEDSIKIAEAIRCSSVCIDAFAVLVGEAALDASSKNHSANHLRHKQSLLGRSKGDLHESWQSRIEYARNAFVDRVNATFNHLIDDKMGWIETTDEFRKLVPPTALSAAYKDAYESLIGGLKEFIRASIHYAATEASSRLDWMEDQDKEQGGEALYPRIDLAGRYLSMDLIERRFTRAFWFNLRDFRFLILRASDFNKHPNWISNRFLSTETAMKGLGIHNTESILGNCDYGQALHKLRGLIAECYNHSINVPPTPTLAQTIALPFRPASQLAGSFTIEAPDDQNDNREVDDISDKWKDLESLGTMEDNPANISSFALYNFFNITQFFREVESYIGGICRQMLDGPLEGQLGTAFDFNAKINLTRTLVCLQETETKFLPLWAAGGLDDGTNGVFDDDVPFAVDGFTNSSISKNYGLGSSSDSSGYEFIGDERSTIGTSTVVNDGYSEAHARTDRRLVYAPNDDESVYADSINYSETSSYAQTERTPAASTDGDSEWNDPAINAAFQGFNSPNDVIKSMPRDEEMYDDVFDDDSDLDMDFGDDENGGPDAGTGNENDSQDADGDDVDFEETESFRGFDEGKDDLKLTHRADATAASTPPANTSAINIRKGTIDNGNGTMAFVISPGKGKGKDPIRRPDTDSEWEHLPEKKRKVTYIVYKDGPMDDQYRP